MARKPPTLAAADLAATLAAGAEATIAEAPTAEPTEDAAGEISPPAAEAAAGLTVDQAVIAPDDGGSIRSDAPSPVAVDPGSTTDLAPMNRQLTLHVHALRARWRGGRHWAQGETIVTDDEAMIDALMHALAADSTFSFTVAEAEA